jgi:hypothetical protein
MWAVTARLLVKSHRNRTCRLCQSGKDVPQGVASPLDCESVHPSALRRERAVRACGRSLPSQPARLGTCCRLSSFFFILLVPTFCPPSRSTSCEESSSKVTSQVGLAQTSARLRFRPGCVDWTGCFDSLRACSWRWLTPAFLTGMARTTTSPTQLNVYSALLPSSCGRKTLWMIGAYFSSTRQS